jgi:hypothetical protein
MNENYYNGRRLGNAVLIQKKTEKALKIKIFSVFAFFLEKENNQK